MHELFDDPGDGIRGPSGADGSVRSVARRDLPLREIGRIMTRALWTVVLVAATVSTALSAVAGQSDSGSGGVRAIDAVSGEFVEASRAGQPTAEEGEMHKPWTASWLPGLIERLRTSRDVGQSPSMSCEPQRWDWLWIAGSLAGMSVLGGSALLLAHLRGGHRRLQHENQRLTELSERDALTGLTNRRGCESAMRAAWPAAGTLVLLDIDHFKAINDTWGHSAGDSVLTAVASRLRTSLHEDDLIVRWGGEEFLIWLPGLIDVDANRVVARLLASVSGDAFGVGEARIGVTASAGFLSLRVAPSDQSLEWDRAVELVDAALYLAKAQGRNRAYGMRPADSNVAHMLVGQARELETGWRDGRIDLVTIDGPTPCVQSPFARCHRSATVLEACA